MKIKNKYWKLEKILYNVLKTLILIFFMYLIFMIFVPRENKQILLTNYKYVIATCVGSQDDISAFEYAYNDKKYTKRHSSECRKLNLEVRFYAKVSTINPENIQILYYKPVHDSVSVAMQPALGWETLHMIDESKIKFYGTCNFEKENEDGSIGVSNTGEIFNVILILSVLYFFIRSIQNEIKNRWLLLRNNTETVGTFVEVEYNEQEASPVDGTPYYTKAIFEFEYNGKIYQTNHTGLLITHKVGCRFYAQIYPPDPTICIVDYFREVID